MTRRFSRLRAGAALALALIAVAAPTAQADTPVGDDQLSIQCPTSTAPVFWATPGVEKDSFGAAPAAQAPPAHPVASSSDSGWIVAVILVPLALCAAGTVAGVRMRRRSLPVA